MLRNKGQFINFFSTDQADFQSNWISYPGQSALPLKICFYSLSARTLMSFTVFINLTSSDL